MRCPGKFGAAGVKAISFWELMQYHHGVSRLHPAVA